MNRLIVFATLALLAQIPHHTHAARQGVSRMDKMFESYPALGCWNDEVTNATTGARLLPTLEGKDELKAILDGHYKNRKNAVKKCFQAALQKKYEVFAVQDGGQCFSSADARTLYKKAGSSDKCEIMKGGPMANNVYEVAPLLKCLIFMPQRHNEKPFATEQSKKKATDETALHIAAKFGEAECAKILINANAQIEAVNKNQKTPLAVAAESNKCEVMKALVQMNANQELLSTVAKNNLRACIPPPNTPETGAQTIDLPYAHLGCFEDSIPRSLDSLEGNSKVTLILEDHYKVRTDAINKCYQAAKKLGYKIFALQDGGQCFSSETATVTYNKYGTSSDCKSGGKGGPMANDVYKIK